MTRAEKPANCFLLEYPHIIHDHSLWEIGTRIWVSRPLSADRYIENEEEIRIEWVGSW